MAMVIQCFLKQIFGSWKNIVNKTETDLLAVWNIWSLKAGFGTKLGNADLVILHVTLWNVFPHARKKGEVNSLEESTQYKIQWFKWTSVLSSIR